jgi:hypothetical protein
MPSYPTLSFKSSIACSLCIYEIVHLFVFILGLLHYVINFSDYVASGWISNFKRCERKCSGAQSVPYLIGFPRGICSWPFTSNLMSSSGMVEQSLHSLIPLLEEVSNKLRPGIILPLTICFTMALPTHSGPWPLIHFRNHVPQTVGLLGREISSSQGLYLNIGQHEHRINAYTHQTSMPWVGFEPTIPASERAKTVYTLDRAATVTGCL